METEVSPYTEDQIDKAHKKLVREIVYRTLTDAVALGKVDAKHFAPHSQYEGTPRRWNPDFTLKKMRKNFVNWVSEPVFHRMCESIGADPHETWIFLLEVALQSKHLVRVEDSLKRLKWEARVYGAKGPKIQEG